MLELVDRFDPRQLPRAPWTYQEDQYQWLSTPPAEPLQAKNFGAVVVRMPSGDIATTVMWVDADDYHVVFNTEVHRNKYKVLEKDPTVTIVAWDAENPYHYAEVRVVSCRPRPAPPPRTTSTPSPRSTEGVDDYPNPIQTERVIRPGSNRPASACSDLGAGSAAGGGGLDVDLERMAHPRHGDHERLIGPVLGRVREADQPPVLTDHRAARLPRQQVEGDG